VQRPRALLNERSKQVEATARQNEQHDKHDPNARRD
jgi:hypothetical protein